MIVPGSANPLLLAMGGDPLDEFGKMRIVRLRAAVGAYFYRAFVSTDTSYTVNFWAKLSLVDGMIACSRKSGAQVGYIDVNSGSIRWNNDTSGGGAAVSAAKVRDPAALYNFTVQVVANNAVYIFKEDEIVATGTAGSNDFLFTSAAGYVNAIGRYGDDASSYFDGGLGNFAYVGGKGDVPPSAFCLRHPRTGQWRPKTGDAIRAGVKVAGGALRNGWGENGFFLPFDDKTSATTLGLDRSQGATDTTGNNWTPSGISVASGPTCDALTDGTDNVATLNPIAGAVSGASLVVDNGNLKATVTSAANVVEVPATIGISEGEYFWEVTAVSIGGTYAWPLSIGISSNGGVGNAVAFASTYYYYNAKTGNFLNNSLTESAYGAAIANGDVVGVKFNATAGTLEFFRKGGSLGVARTGISAGKWFPKIGCNDSSIFFVNFGQQPFVYPANQGAAKTLCAKNIKRPPIDNVKSAFVAVTDTGANILATLAAARPAFGSYIDIVKRRDPTAEGWRWSFSDDPGFALDSSSSTAGRFAYPALAGTSYVGYSLRVSSVNGVATGRLNHVSGTADVVPDGLSNSRKAVIMTNEAGSAWWFYHPELTNGKLLYLNTPDGETTDATLNTVTPSSFTVSAALASGRYRWISLAEIDGFLKLFKYLGNGGSDGADSVCGLRPIFVSVKNISGGASHAVFDTSRDPVNQATHWLIPNSSAGENVSEGLDMVSNGFKTRFAAGTMNGTANHVGIAIGQSFRYANAR